MGNKMTNVQISFDDIQQLIQKGNELSFPFLLIHTLPENEQECLILHTLTSSEETQKINEILVGGSEMAMKKQNIKIFIYGRNSNDSSVLTKYKQLLMLGFPHVFIFSGGLFEWLLLQDIYGEDMFPTTGEPCLDFLKYKPKSLLKFSGTNI